jgi:hypothetical protein
MTHGNSRCFTSDHPVSKKNLHFPGAGTEDSRVAGRMNIKVEIFMKQRFPKFNLNTHQYLRKKII